jgi:hypothetical protein
MNMNLSELINEIISEWAYRVDDGMPDAKNLTHLKELGIVLQEMGLYHIKDILIENLLIETGTTPQEVDEAEESSFKNPILNKVIKYKNTKGEETDGVVGNLLRLPAEHPGRKAAEALLPPEGSKERDSMNQDLGGQNQAAKPDAGGEKKDGEKEDGGADDAEQKKQQAAMFTGDPAMVARMDKEKETLAKLAQKDKEASDKKAELDKKEEPNPLDAKFSEPSNPPPQNEKGVEKDGKIVGTTIETEPKLDEIDPKFLKEKSTEMNKYYEHFKEDKKKAEAEAMAKLGYTPEQVKDLKDESKKEFEDEVKKNQEPTYNLCKVTVPNSNLFCSGNKGIPRKDMPQFKGEPVEGTQAWDVLQKAKEKDPTATEAEGEPYFRQMLADKGIKVTDAEVPSESLKATQSELVGDKVLGMKSVLDAGPSHPAYKKMTSPLFVSRDGYVVDGHHRWAAITAYNMEHPDNPLPLKTMIIDQDIDEAIETSNTFANEFGVAAKSGKQTGADAQKQAEPPMDEPGRPDTTPVQDKSSIQSMKGESKTIKGKKSGKDIQTIEMEGGGMVYGTQHRNTAMVDDILDDIKSKIPKERWKDIVFVGEGGATNNDGELEFNDEMDYAAPKFKELGAGIDSWDGDDLDVHNNESKLYKKQKEKTGLEDNQILAGNWASMIGQGESEGLDPNDPENRMKAEDYLDDDGKQFLQDAAKEAGLPPIENFDNPTGEKPSEENGWKGTGDRGTLYRLAFPGDNGDKETKINDIQVAFNETRDENILEKTKELQSNGKIPITIAGEGHIDLVNGMMKNENPQKEMKEENLQLADELMLQMIYEFIDEAKPNAKAQRILNQRIKYKEDGVEHDVKVSTALKYKNSEKGGQKKAYRDALQLLKKAGVAIPDAGATKKPVGKTIAPSGFRKTPDMEKKPTKAAPKEEPKQTKRSETNNPHKKNGDEGQTILEVKPEELDSILEKYVNTGEATPDDMREVTPEYSNQDMAEGYADEDFYSDEHKAILQKQKIKVRTEPYRMDDTSKQNLRDAGFPEKYIKFLERCINTQVNGKKPAVTELIKQGGAGQIQSQFGEVMAMAFMSIRDPNVRRQMADVLNSEIAKSAQEFGGGKASPIATKDWVEASLTHAEAFDSAMDEKYGKGQWRFEGAAWDIKGDIEALGLDYKNKGFSTDVMLRVQPLKNGKPNGPARAQKNSLKKDENIFFFNGSINEVNNFVLNFLDEKERKRVKGYEAIVTKAGASNKNKEDRAAALAAAERITGLKGTKAIAALKQLAGDIRTKAFDSAPPNVQQAVSKVRNFGAAQTKSAEGLIKTANTNIRNANSVIDNAKNIDGGDKDFAKFAYKTVKDCKASGTKDITTCIRQKLSAAGEDTTDDRVCKVAVLASKVAIAAGDTKAEKALSKHYSLAVEAGNALMNVLPESEQLMGGLMQKLADAFPMKTCMQGEEFMCIDGMKVTQKTLQTVFGVANYEELQKGMKLKRLPNGETILVYGAKTKDGKDIPIGVVGARQKGKGYEGTVGFEISCSDDFALAIAEANRKNGDASTSNEKARQSIGKRVNNRAAKAGKKK